MHKMGSSSRSNSSDKKRPQAGKFASMNKLSISEQSTIKTGSKKIKVVKVKFVSSETVLDVGTTVLVNPGHPSEVK